uniref:RING-type domain-containing protein n=1 Tax=Parastrongyloides trichosuri TaxID=131310 RepID=A0A0N4ZBB9_PARTI
MVPRKQKTIIQDSAKHIIAGTNPPLAYSSKANNNSFKTKKKESTHVSGNDYVEKIDNKQEILSLLTDKESQNTGMTMALFDLQRNLTSIETKYSLLQNELNVIKMTIAKHDQEISSHDAIHRIKQVDSKVKNLNSQFDGIMAALEKEVKSKEKFNALQTDAYNKLQEHVTKQLNTEKNNLNNSFYEIQKENKALKKQMLQLESNIKASVATINKSMKDIENNMKLSEKDRKQLTSFNNEEVKLIKKELTTTNNTIQNNLNNRLEKLSNDMIMNEKNSRILIEEKNNLLKEKYDNDFIILNRSIGEIKDELNNSNIEKSEALKMTDEKVSKLEKNLQKIEKNVGKVFKESQQVTSTTKRHEEGIMRKLDTLENQLNVYIDDMNKKIAESNRPKTNDSINNSNSSTGRSINNSKTPEKIKQELLMIMNDKEKMSYQGMLAAEEKILNLQKQMESFKGDFEMKTKELPDSKLTGELQKQMLTFETMMNQVQETQSSLNKKIDQDIPANMEEFSMKTKNLIQALDNKFLHEINLLQKGMKQSNKANKSLIKDVDEKDKKRAKHEEMILTKLLKLEDDVKRYIDTKNREMDEDDNDRRSINNDDSNIDIEKIRTELSLIVNERSKLTYQTSLIMEEKVINMQENLNNFRKELDHKCHLKGLDDPRIIEMQKQLASVNMMMNDMENVQKDIKEKLDEEIPSNIEEMSIKMKNALNLIGKKINQEEEERYLSIKELQEVYAGLAIKYKTMAKQINSKSNENEEIKKMKLELDKCKDAVKKLAESLTTMKSNIESQVIDKKK